MKHVFLATTFFVSASGFLQAQDAGTSFKKSEERTVQSLGLIDMQTSEPQYDPWITTTGIYHDPDDVLEVPPGTKIKYPDMVEDGGKASRSSESPFLVGNWNGYNDANYTPPDNSVAISNDGIIVSAMNCNYRVFDRTGKLMTGGYSTFFDAFKTKFPNLPNKYFDPRVIYDPEKDRFIMVILNGSTHDVSKILIMFSRTNNPVDGWYLYSVSGDVLNNQLWTDYPAIAVSSKELFITGNLFDDWMQYDQSFVLQMNKDDGFSGGTLNYQVWSDLTNADGARTFSPLPIGYGIQGNYGAGMYVVSNDRISSNAISLFHITNSMDAPNEQMERFTINIPFTILYPFVSGQNSSADNLNAGDARPKSGFYLNGIIHYVMATRNSSGNTSIAYFRIDAFKKTADYRLLGQSGYNYSYPSIISLAGKPEDKSVLIGFLRGGESIYPGIRVVHCNDAFEFSSSVAVKDGVTAVNELTQDNTERWGDYTGFARKYNSVTGVFAGCYGSGGRWKTHIAEVGLPSQVSGIQQEEPKEESDLVVYPNPARDLFTTTFTLKKRMQIEIAVYDMLGHKVIALYKGMELPGGKQFSFNRAALAKGTYLLRVTGEKGDIASEKVIVQ
jgi:hypothetical protein